MENIIKTKEQLVEELEAIRQHASELEQAERLLATLFISLPIGIYIVQDRQFQFVSSKFRQITEYGEDELIGMDSLELVLHEDKKIVRENAIKMLKGKLSFPYEYRIVTRGGKIKWIMENVASIQYYGRRAVLGCFMDITERKRAEEALRESEERYRDLFESTNDLVQSVKPDGHFLYVNRAWREVLHNREEGHSPAFQVLWNRIQPCLWEWQNRFLHTCDIFSPAPERLYL